MNFRPGWGGSEANILDAFSKMDFDDNCDFKVLLTGQVIRTTNSSEIAKNAGITFGHEPCGNRPIVLSTAALASEHLLSHEFGHAVGWYDTVHPMVNPETGQKDPMHSGLPLNLMGYNDDPRIQDQLKADDQWCRRLCKCAEKRTDERNAE